MGYNERKNVRERLAREIIKEIHRQTKFVSQIHLCIKI